jgi:tRNA A-37 threonylcarbamoyl transferase component Bud32
VSLAAGGRLGPYEIVAPSGSGGMGEVYRARDTRLGREVAIKVLRGERLLDEHRRARFVQEARAASALNHPNIGTVYDIASAEGTDFIVMELVPGKTLDALIPRHGMRLGEVLRVAIPLADALAAAHAAGIVHRDLKPANVMVTPEGAVKVLDFGLAKLTQAEEGAREDATTLDARAKLSHPGTVAGTPAYMSPEQASGGVVDARSDVFSFGAVLYEMVTGRRPFTAGSSAEMLAALLKEEPKPPSEVVPELPKELERIILHCLRKEPGRRFQHLADVKVELEELKEESDSQAETPPGAVTAVNEEATPPGVVGGWPARPGFSRRRGAVARAPTRAAAALSRPAHVGAARRERQLLSRRHPDRLRVGGREGRQLGHLAEDRGPGRGPTPHHRRRGREVPGLVPGRNADRVPAPTGHHRTPDPGLLQRRHHPSRVAGGRTGAAALRLPRAAPGFLVARWSLAGHGEGPIRERPAGRDPPHLRDERRAAGGDVPEAASVRRLPGLLAGRSGARLRLL